MKENKKETPEVEAQEQLRICPSCKQSNKSDANSCENCRIKISGTCINCWVRNRQLYNFKFDKCPGYKLFILEKSKS